MDPSLLTQIWKHNLISDGIPFLIFTYYRVLRISTGSGASTEFTPPPVSNEQSALYTGLGHGYDRNCDSRGDCICG